MGLWLETAIALTILFGVHLVIYSWIRKPAKKSIRDRHVVVTGGSSGIGLCIARQCIKLGAHVTIVARNKANLADALDQLTASRLDGKQKLQFRSLDLAKSYDAVEQCFAELEQSVGAIYALINCAGMAICGTVDETALDDARKMMDINYWATFHPTRYVLRRMKSVGDGIITITGSQASLLGIYGYGPYAAAKFALRGLAETIAMEVSSTKISVTLALPADTGSLSRWYETAADR